MATKEVCAAAGMLGVIGGAGTVYALNNNDSGASENFREEYSLDCSKTLFTNIGDTVSTSSSKQSDSPNTFEWSDSDVLTPKKGCLSVKVDNATKPKAINFELSAIDNAESGKEPTGLIILSTLSDFYFENDNSNATLISRVLRLTKNNNSWSVEKGIEFKSTIPKEGSKISGLDSAEKEVKSLCKLKTDKSSCEDSSPIRSIAAKTHKWDWNASGTSSLLEKIKITADGTKSFLFFGRDWSTSEDTSVKLTINRVYTKALGWKVAPTTSPTAKAFFKEPNKGTWTTNS